LTAFAVLLLASAGQATRVDAPWLTVYDPAGQPRWEVQLEQLTRTAQGWQGEHATIHLYHEGLHQATARAAALQADPSGRAWEMSEGIEVDWAEFELSCKRGRWNDELVLWDITATAEGLVVGSEQARWRPGGPVELLGGTFDMRGWTATFDAGQYSLPEGTLSAQEVHVSGHGMDLWGATLAARPQDGTITLQNARLATRP